MKCLEVSCVNQWLHEIVKWEPICTHLFHLTLVDGSDRIVLLIDTTLKGSDLLLETIDPTTLTYLLPSILQTCICLAPLVSHILSPPAGIHEDKFDLCLHSIWVEWNRPYYIWHTHCHEFSLMLLVGWKIWSCSGIVLLRPIDMCTHEQTCLL